MSMKLLVSKIDAFIRIKVMMSGESFETPNVFLS